MRDGQKHSLFSRMDGRSDQQQSFFIAAQPAVGTDPRFLTAQVQRSNQALRILPHFTGITTQGTDRVVLLPPLAKTSHRTIAGARSGGRRGGRRGGGQASARGQGAWCLRWRLLYTGPMSVLSARRPPLRIQNCSKSKCEQFCSPRSRNLRTGGTPVLIARGAGAGTSPRCADITTQSANRVVMLREDRPSLRRHHHSKSKPSGDAPRGQAQPQTVSQNLSTSNNINQPVTEI